MKKRILTLALALITLLSGWAQTINREQLDMVITALNAQCPQSLNNGLTIIKYDLQMDYLIIYFESEYVKPDTNTGERVDNVFKDGIMMMFTQESAAPFANIMVENGLGFEAYVTYADGEKAVMLVTPREFADAIKNRQELSPEELLNGWLGNIQQTLPLNEGGVITTAVYDEDGYIVYVMENEELAETFAQLDDEMFSAAMAYGLSSIIETNKSTYKMIADTGRGLKWKIMTPSGLKTGTVSNADLRDMCK